MKKQLVIFGTRNIAELAYFYFTHDSNYTVAAFTVDKEYIATDTFCGLPLIDFDSVEEQYPPNNFEFFVALSYAKMNAIRTEKYLAAKAKGYKLASYISSKATVWSEAVIGDNCFLLEDNTIQPFTKIGNNVTLWSGNHIGHHSEIKENCFISSHVVVSGGVVIEENCFLGVNATLRDHIVIGKNCLIGAGALVLKNTEAYSINRGSPAKAAKVTTKELKNI